jgi:hypothetical protein
MSLHRHVGIQVFVSLNILLTLLSRLEETILKGWKIDQTGFTETLQVALDYLKVYIGTIDNMRLAR